MNDPAVRHDPEAGLLAGMQVLDLSIWRPGPYATQLLAEAGADVIKVEPPHGDPMRAYPRLFASLHANKRGIVLDLKSAEGRARALDLAATADVVIESFRPGVAARLGVGYDDVRAVNENVVYCSISGFGQDGPLSMVPGHDLNYQAWAGVLAPDGGAPIVSAVPMADLAAGMAAAFGICAAVIRRMNTGEGEHVDVAMADVLSTWTGAAAPVPDETDAARRGVPGYGTFETADGGFVALGIVSEDHFWRALCDTLDLPDHRALGFADRVADLVGLQERIAGAVRTRARDDLVAELLAADVPVAPVFDRAEMVASEHFRTRGAVSSDPWADPATGYPIRFVRHPARRTTAPPTLDRDHDARFERDASTVE